MYIFLLIFAVLFSAAEAFSYGFRTQQHSIEQQQSASIPTTTVQPPAFIQLQEQLDKNTAGPSDIGNQALNNFAFAYDAMNDLLTQNSSEWKNYFASGSGAKTIKNIASKITEANTWIGLATATPAQGIDTFDALANKKRHDKAIVRYTAAAKTLMATLQFLGLQAQVPAILMLDLSAAAPVSTPTAPSARPTPPPTPASTPMATPAQDIDPDAA